MNRRTFVKSLAALPCVVTAAAASDRITGGFIGTGARGGSGLIKMFLPLPDCQGLATCNPFKDRREAWA